MKNVMTRSHIQHGVVGWNVNLYVIGNNNDESHILLLSRPCTTKKILYVMDITKAWVYSIVMLILWSKVENTLIVNEKKQDMQWQWNQARVSRILKPYCVMLSEQDDLLLGSDDLKAFEASKSAANMEFLNISDAMLEDTELNEHKVAAFFFGGFPLFNVKIRLLQSQLGTLKVVNHVNVLSLKRGKSEGTVQLHSKSSYQSKSSWISQSSSDNIPTVEEEATSRSYEGTRMLGASL
jgi:hypothetical protein